MAHIVVHRIEELARRRLAVAWQRAALPPQPIRADTNLWQLTRVGFAHARTPKMMSRSIGRGTPAQQLLRDDPALAERMQEQFPELDLAELIVSPELPSELADAVQTNVATYDPNAPAEDQLALYKPSGVTRTLICLGTGQTPTASPAKTEIIGAGAQAPLIIRGVSWLVPFIPTGANEIQVEVSGLGVVYTSRIFDTEQHAVGNAGNMAQWILAGEVHATITIYWDTAQGGIPYSVAAYVIVEPLIRIG